MPISGGPRKVILDAGSAGVIFSEPVFTADLKHFIFTGSSPEDRSNLYYWDGKSGKPDLLTDLNPVLRSRSLGKQEVIRYKARDGQEIEGLLIHPVGEESGNLYPLIVYVHGGPESHHSNGWLSRYSTPGQVMAGKGYLVLYLNYRASTGYGVDFAMTGFMDPAGVEFDDIADGIDYVVQDRGADPDRVGLAGGSYGGYASGWFATYYTKFVKAVCMFVGISNNISKRGTTDIAYEELYVHSGKPLEEQWQMALERSPIYWAHQSKTATLIYGGAADTRVHPSQSFELYRRMKMNDHPAVRLVQYPGEGHGNRKQVGRIDVLYRQMEWLDWYVKDLHPLDGPMPRLDISDRYGLDWDSCGNTPQWIGVQGNSFVNESGEKVIFQGVNIRDPHNLEEEGNWKPSLFAEAKNWGANVIRLPIHPRAWRARGEAGYLKLIDQAVDWARDLDLYLILDWHSIGNLKDEKFQHKMYVTTWEETRSFWNTVSKRYASEPVIVLYELYNEPTISGDRFGDMSWEDWKEMNEEMIRIIRKNHPRSLIGVAGFNWAYDLVPVRKQAVDAEGIVYISHPYPEKRDAPWEKKWEKDWGFVAEKYPVFLTEIGFALPHEKGAHVPVNGDESYGKALVDYTAARGISWVVWCFDPDWSPHMFTDWDYTPTRQGKFFKKVMQGSD